MHDHHEQVPALVEPDQADPPGRPLIHGHRPADLLSCGLQCAHLVRTWRARLQSNLTKHIDRGMYALHRLPILLTVRGAQNLMSCHDLRDRVAQRDLVEGPVEPCGATLVEHRRGTVASSEEPHALLLQGEWNHEGPRLLSKGMGMEPEQG